MQFIYSNVHQSIGDSFLHHCETPRTLFSIVFNLIKILFRFAVGVTIWQQTQTQVRKWEGRFAKHFESNLVRHQQHRQLLWKVGMTFYRLYQCSFTISACKPEHPYILVIYCSICNTWFFRVSIFHSIPLTFCTKCNRDKFCLVTGLHSDPGQSDPRAQMKTHF